MAMPAENMAAVPPTAPQDHPWSGYGAHPEGVKVRKYRVTAPNGKVYEVTAPEHATQDQVLSYVQSHVEGSAQGGNGSETTYTPQQLLTALHNAQQAGDQHAIQVIQQHMQAIQHQAQPTQPSQQYTREQLGQAYWNAAKAGDHAAMQTIYDHLRAQGYTLPGPNGEDVSHPPPMNWKEDLAHAALLTNQNVMHGVGDVAGLVWNPIAYGVNKAEDAMGVDPSNHLGYANQNIDWALRAAGYPEVHPNNTVERYGSQVERGVTGAAATMGLGNTIARNAVSDVGRHIGETLAEKPLTQAASTAGGAVAAEYAKEHGASPSVQLLAGLGGGMLPSAIPGAAAATQYALRGGEAGRQALSDAVHDFSAAGTSPTVGQATGNRRTQAMEALLARAPGASGVMSRSAERQAQEVRSALQDHASRLAPGADPIKAGRAINRGVTGAGGFIDRFKAESGDLYGKLADVFKPNTPVSARYTEQALKSMTDSTPGLEAMSAQFADPKLRKIRDALEKDLSQNHAKNGRRAVPYQGLMRLRAQIGEKLADLGFGSGDNSIQRTHLKRLYSAITKDMQAAVAHDPAAKRALNRANAYYHAGMNRIDSISHAVDKSGGPEKVFQAAMSGTSQGATTLKAVMQSLKPDERRVVAAAVLRRMGMATPGLQNAEGDVFNMKTFLTNWNRLSPQAKGALFNRMGPSFREDMDSIARTAARVKSAAGVHANPSGTAATGLQLGTAASFILSLLHGDMGTAAGIAGATGSADLLARAMTSPKVVRWLAKQTHVSISGQLPNIAHLRNTTGISGDHVNPAVRMAQHAWDNTMRKVRERIPKDRPVPDAVWRGALKSTAKKFGVTQAQILNTPGS